MQEYHGDIWSVVVEGKEIKLTVRQIFKDLTCMTQLVFPPGDPLGAFLAKLLEGGRLELIQAHERAHPLPDAPPVQPNASQAPKKRRGRPPKAKPPEHVGQ